MRIQRQPRLPDGGLLFFPRAFAVEEATRKTFDPTVLLGVWIVSVAALVVAPLIVERFGVEYGKGSWPIEAGITAELLACAVAGTLLGAWTAQPPIRTTRCDGARQRTELQCESPV